MTHDADTRPSRIDPTGPLPELEHVTIEPENAPPECAIFPREGTEAELLSQWITAQGGSFVSLESMR